MGVEENFDREFCRKLQKSHNTWKSPVIEYIFISKFNSKNRPSNIPFSHSELKYICSNVIGWDNLDEDPKGNYNNFVKDLVRNGNYSPRSDAAQQEGYVLRESSDDDYIGVLVDEDTISADLSISCPDEIDVVIHEADFPEAVNDLIRPDEGGLLSALDYCDLLSAFFSDQPGSSVKRVQAPVKKQPEIDGLYVLEKVDARYLLPCEAKSRGSDVINMHQIEGATKTAFKVVSDARDKSGREGGLFESLDAKQVKGVYPLGAKILEDGDIHIAKFGLIEEGDLDELHDVLSTKGVTKHARYRLSPKPPQW
jgi:hypothetical protein